MSTNKNYNKMKTLTKKELEQKGWIFFTHSGGAICASHSNGNSYTAKTLATVRKHISDHPCNN